MNNINHINDYLVKKMIKKRQKGGKIKIFNNILDFFKKRWYIILIIFFVCFLLIIRTKDRNKRRIESEQFVNYMKNRELYIEELSKIKKEKNQNQINMYATEMYNDDKFDQDNNIYDY